MHLNHSDELSLPFTQRNFGAGTSSFEQVRLIRPIRISPPAGIAILLAVLSDCDLKRDACTSAPGVVFN